MKIVIDVIRNVGYSVVIGNKQGVMNMQEWVNSLTSEQYTKLLDIAYGEVPVEIKNLTDDELLAELRA